MLPPELRALITSYLPNNQALSYLIDFSFSGLTIPDNQSELETRRQKARQLEQLLQSFHVGGQIIEVTLPKLDLVEFKYQSIGRVIDLTVLQELANTMIAQRQFWHQATGHQLMNQLGQLTSVSSMNRHLVNTGCQLLIVPLADIKMCELTWSAVKILHATKCHS